MFKPKYLKNNIRIYLFLGTTLALTLLPNSSLLAQASPTVSASNFQNKPATGIIVNLRAGTDLHGEVIELTNDSLTINTKHGEVVLKIRDIEQQCWERIVEEIPKSITKRTEPKNQTKKRFVSEMITNKPEDNELPDLEKISLGEINYQFRKYFKSVNNSIEFIYSPENQPDPSIAKDNLTIWVLDNSEGKTSEELTASFLERFKPESKNFELDKTNDATLFFGDRSRDKDNNSRYIMGKTYVDGTTGWVLIYTQTNSEGELKGWKTDKLAKYKEELKNFIKWPIELLNIDTEA